MSEHNYFKAHMTYTDGTTETCTNERLYDLISKAQHLVIAARVTDGLELKTMRLSTMFNDGDELGPYEIHYVED